jgi:preprotein translocase subunit SecE
MARQTRAQRRARRAEALRQGAQVERPRAAEAAPARAPRVSVPSRDGGERRAPGGGFRRFVGESWGELKKVEWPGQNQLIQGVIVVIIACVIVGIFLWSSDLVLKRVVEKVFLGQ